MDSPLLPQLDRHPDMSLLDDSSLLEDMTLDSEPNASGAHYHDDRDQDQNLYHDRASHQHLFNQDDNRGAADFGVASAAASGSGSKPAGAAPRHSIFGPPGGHGARGRAAIDRQMDDEEEENTPVTVTVTKDRYTTGIGAGAGAGAGAAKAKPRFSLFAPPRPPSPEDLHEDDEESPGQNEEEDDQDQTIHGRAIAIGQSQSHDANEHLNESQDRGSSGSMSGRGTMAGREARENKLRESLYELRRMNEVFDGFLGALEGVRGHNERLAQRVQQTSALLDEYTAIMGQTEFTQRLLLNPKWTGSADDAEAIAAEEQARFLAQQAAEEEARRQAEAARLAEEEKERREALAKERSERGGLGGRGAGTAGRGRNRGGFGAGGTTNSTSARGGAGTGTGTGTGTVAAGRARGTGIPRPSTIPRPTSGTGVRRGTTTTTTTSSSTSSSSRTNSASNGLGGQYSHVKSSGYGPR
ncbi:hypothetical protein IAT40_004911 [Kwoniella sp. CBS 6097]